MAPHFDPIADEIYYPMDGAEAIDDFAPNPPPPPRSDTTVDALTPIAGAEVTGDVHGDNGPESDDIPPIPCCTSPDSFPPVQLGANDIDTIVKALLLPLSDVLSQLTPDQQYAALFTEVSKLALGKTFANDDELASLVQDISNQVVEKIAADPDSCPSDCPDGCYTNTTLCYGPCC